MSANRNGTIDPMELTWDEFLVQARRDPVCRVQGKVDAATSHTGRLVRFNRAVEVQVHTAQGEGPRRRVHAERVRWDWRKKRWVRLGRRMVLTWGELDWVTWKATGDPNYTWMKVTR